MRSLELDILTGDLKLTTGRLTLVTGAVAVAQRLRGRLSLWQGAWFADTAIGIPYLRFFGVKGAAAFAESTLRRAILTCSGVVALESFAQALDASARDAAVSFRARTTDGAVIEDNGFRLGVEGRV